MRNNGTIPDGITASLRDYWFRCMVVSQIKRESAANASCGACIFRGIVMPILSSNRTADAAPTLFSANTNGAPSRRHQVPRSRLDGQKILVVEDQFIEARALATYLRESGAEVIGPVPTVAHGLRTMSVHCPTGAILDIKLGDELVFPVADHLAEAGIPYIFFSHAFRDVPGRHILARRVEKCGGYTTLLHALLADHARHLVGLTPLLRSNPIPVEAALPRLRLLARLLCNNHDSAEYMVEIALLRAASLTAEGLHIQNPTWLVANLIELVLRERLPDLR